MSESIAVTKSTPVEGLDPEVIAFRRQFEDGSPLDRIVREGAQQMLQAAIDAEVEAFVGRHGDRRDEQGRRRLAGGAPQLPASLPPLTPRRLDSVGTSESAWVMSGMMSARGMP